MGARNWEEEDPRSAVGVLVASVAGLDAPWREVTEEECRLWLKGRTLTVRKLKDMPQVKEFGWRSRVYPEGTQKTGWVRQDRGHLIGVKCGHGQRSLNSVWERNRRRVQKCKREEGTHLSRAHCTPDTMI